MSPVEGTAASIGKSVQIRGEVKGSEDLIVDGEVEGTITLTESKLTIGPNARVNANVSARDVVILGKLNGSVLATGKVELRQGSHLIGDITAGRLSIEENAVFSGKVDLVQGTAAATTEKTSAGSQFNPAASTSALF
ncbi:MAG TPA: polymer-forming cytoskeletal protein [Acidisarcina sp.]